MSGNSTLEIAIGDRRRKSGEGASLPLSVVLFGGLVLSVTLAFGLRAVGRAVFGVPFDLPSLATGAILPAAIFPVLGTCFGFFMSFRAKPGARSMQLFLGIGAVLALFGVAISASKLPAAPSSTAVVFTVATSLLPTIGIVAALLVFVPRTPVRRTGARYA